LRHAEIKSGTLYLIGSRKKDLEKSVKNLRISFPGLTIVGRHSGHYKKDEETAVLTAGEWQAWAIGLDAFGAGGLQVNRVRTLYVGVGDRDNPVAGGTGVVYIDDIQFGRPAAVD